MTPGIPKRLVNLAKAEMAWRGVIALDTAAELIEHGADMYALEAEVAEEAARGELVDA